MKTPKRKSFLARKLAELREQAKKARAQEARYALADRLEAAVPGASIHMWDWETGIDLSIRVDRFGEAAPALKALRAIFGRRPDSMPAIRTDSIERAWSWTEDGRRITLTATLTGKVCRLEQIGETVTEVPAKTVRTPIYKLVCPPEEVTP